MGVSSARALSVLLQALVFANAISGKKAFRNAERLLLCLCAFAVDIPKNICLIVNTVDIRKTFVLLACAVEIPKNSCLIVSVHVALRLHGNKQVSQQQHFFIATLQATFSTQKPFWRFVLRCSGNKKMVHVTSKISVSTCK